MSSIIVEVCEINNVSPHVNADALELAVIKGWQVVVPINTYRPGDLVTYIPIDSLVPRAHAEKWGIDKYLAFHSDNPDMGRVRCAKLRGEPSFGVIIAREDAAWEIGRDVQAHYGIEKYEPPVKLMHGDAEIRHPLFVEYTDIENLRNFPGLFQDGEIVSVTEKIHGTCSRVGIIESEIMAGSMSVRRRMPECASGDVSLYWQPMRSYAVKSLLEYFATRCNQVMLFGEIFGPKVQNLTYGVSDGVDYRAFDLLLDGKYMDTAEFRDICSNYGVPIVPELYRGAYSLDAIVGLSKGNTTLMDGSPHIREGVVVKPIRERTDPKVGRVCMKYIGDQYLFAKGVTDSQDV